MSLTWYDYTIILGGHLKKYYQQWEHSRFIGYWNYAMQSTKPVTIDKFYPLPTDTKPEQANYQPEDLQKLSEMAMQRLAYLNK